MKFNADVHHRRSLRLNGYDYSAAGAYFVTICAHGRECLFGEIVDGEMRGNDFGLIVEAEWKRSAEIRSEIELGEFVVMPNHFHGIARIADFVGAYGHTPLHATPFRSPSKTIGAMIRGFKAAVTTQINQLRGTPHVPVWQRNYHEHIIRNDSDYRRIAEYIATNPHYWVGDDLYPDHKFPVSDVSQHVGAYGHTPLRRTTGD
jgi:REP element-mobilizing transposase RayT